MPFPSFLSLALWAAAGQNLLFCRVTFARVSWGYGFQRADFDVGDQSDTPA